MIRKIIIGAIFLLGLVVAYNLLMQIMYSLRSSERLSQAADRVYQLEAKNRQLKKKLSEIKSPEFIEEVARNKLGYSKAGETIVIIPEEKLKEVLGISQPVEIRLPNWLGWFRVFFH